METKRLKQADGTVVYYVNINGTNKMHNVDNYAYIPKGSRSKAEYYIFGFKYSKDDFLDIKKDGNGVPFHKTAAGKQSGTRA